MHVQEESQDFDYIKINLASPDRIKHWGEKILPNGQIIGEVTKPETINYRTFKPEVDGLFCERIFGPIKSWECHCGRYKQVRDQGLICEYCGVELTESKVRRHRMGYIDLLIPVTHIWYLKGVPSYIAHLLEQPIRTLEKIVYFNETINTNSVEINETSNSSKLLKQRESENSGAEVLYNLLKNLNLEEEIQNSRDRLINPVTELELKSINRRIRILESFITTQSKPEWMILTVIPIIPPGLRPMVQLEGGRFATSDLNELYRRVITRNNRLSRLLSIYAPDIVLRSERRMLQEAVDGLIDNGKRGLKTVDMNNRPLKSLADTVEGKQGRFRQNLLGKRVDYSGRSVIIVGPHLQLNQCGLPYEMAIELYQPFVIHELINQNLAETIRMAKKIIQTNDTFVWNLLKRILKGHPVLLNRAPTLHRLGIQAFEPILVKGRAIQLHPLVCPAFNADFDGDQMAVHLPLSLEAQTEARILMLAPNNFLSPATGEPILQPTQDMLLGCYYLTTVNEPNIKGSNHYFSNLNDVLIAFDQNKLTIHSFIWVRSSIEVDITNSKPIKKIKLNDGSNLEIYENLQKRISQNNETLVQYIRTTPGRIIFNKVLSKLNVL